MGHGRPKLGRNLIISMKNTMISSNILLAQLVFVMVPGSVEEERMFSAMKYLKNVYRNRLLEVHLTMCARAFHHPRVTLSNFPYKHAIRFWLEQKERRMV